MVGYNKKIFSHVLNMIINRLFFVVRNGSK